MEMEGRVYSDLYRNSSEDMFMRTMMESSVGIAAPTMEMMGYKNLSNNFRADSEELFKSWLTTGENQGLVHNRPRQLSRMVTDQASHQNGALHLTERSSENLTPQSPLAVGESSCGMNGHSVRNLAEKGLQATNLYLAKAWFNSSQPMTRSRSSELRRKYVAMQNSQTTIGIEAMHNASGLGIKRLKQDFVNPSEFREDSSSSTCSVPKVGPVDNVSSVVSMLKGTLERKKDGNHVEKEAIEDRSFGYHSGHEVFAYSHVNQVHEIHMHDAHGGTFQDLTKDDINDPMYADLESFMDPSNLIHTNIESRDPSQSESSADAPVISTGFDISDGPSNSRQSPSVCESPRNQVENAKRTGNGCVAKDIKEHIYHNLKEDHKHKGNLCQHGSMTSAGSAERGDPTKKRRVERSRKMAEANKRTQTPATSSDMQSILKRCENLEKEVRSLKLNLAFMNRKDSEQTKQIEELQKQNEDMGDEKERLLEEIDRILSRMDCNKYQS